MREVDFQEALETLRRGQILVYPTETVYGLGVDIAQEKVLARLFALKGREAAKSVSVLVGTWEQLTGLVLLFDNNLLNLIKKFIPGPLTLVLPAGTKAPRQIVASDGTIGIRWSSHPVAQRLAESFGPITTTSANPSGLPAALSAEQVEAYFRKDENVALLRGEDSAATALASTVVKATEQGLTLIREGAIAFSEIEKAYGIKKS